jgi:hypothetical protein
VLDRLLFSSRSTKSVDAGFMHCQRDLADSPSIAIESPILSNQGAQVALLKATFTISVMDARAALQQAMDANAEMASAPIDPAAQLPPDLSVVANTSPQLDFLSVLGRLDGLL